MGRDAIGATAALAKPQERRRLAPERVKIVSLATLVIALSGLALLRIAALALNGTDLFLDEAQYWAWSRELAFGYYSKPPAIAWIIAGATQACGDGEVCVRLPSVLIHTATSFLVFLLGRRLYSFETGFWSALVFATLPGVSLSSGIISTDVPLLFAWALALLALAELVRSPSLAPALVLAVALGLGLNAKYAMAYFVASAAIFFIVDERARALLKRPYPWIALAGGLLLIAPNLVWNSEHDFATVAHTADNAGWREIPLHPGKAAEFFLAQFGVFGPILFGALLVIVWRARKSVAALAPADRYLLAFSAPLVAAITLQAFVSHAFANWAAPAYIAASVLVTAVFLREGSWKWLTASLGLNLAIGVLIAVATWQAGKFAIPGAGDPFARTLGNRELAAAVRGALADAERAGKPYAAVAAIDREVTAPLLYYGRDFPVPVYAWREGEAPRDHFELTRPYVARSGEPALLVSRRNKPGALSAFARVDDLGPRKFAAGRFTTRTIHLFAASDYRGR